MKKVTDLDEARDPCPFCGKRPACFGWTCKRLASVSVDGDCYTVEFVEEHEDEPAE